jgi:hypothetical protein
LRNWKPRGLDDDRHIGRHAHLHQRAPGLADRRPTPGVCPGPQSGRGRLDEHKNSLGNLGGCSTPDQLAAIIKNRLKRIQYRPALIDGFLAQTGLSLEPQPP